MMSHLLRPMIVYTEERRLLATWALTIAVHARLDAGGAWQLCERLRACWGIDVTVDLLSFVRDASSVEAAQRMVWLLQRSLARLDAMVATGAAAARSDPKSA